MFRSKRVKWIGLGLFIVVFIVLSMYRYQVVNKPFENYSITEIPMEQNVPIVIDNAIYEYETPIITEQEDKFTYKIPLTITNNRAEDIGMDYENFIIYSKHLIQNGIALDEVMNHPENEGSTAIFGGVPPGSKDELILMFYLMKDWKVELDTEVEMYHVYISGDTVEKYKLALNY